MNLVEVLDLLRQLHALVMSECPRVLDEDRGGCGELAVNIEGVLEKIATADQVWVSIRDGDVVGTPFGPEIPDGKYVIFDELDSQKQKEYDKEFKAKVIEAINSTTYTPHASVMHNLRNKLEETK